MVSNYIHSKFNSYLGQSMIASNNSKDRKLLIDDTDKDFSSFSNR